MNKPVFRPAPRPRASASSDDEARRLAEASRDLGFARPSTAPELAEASAEQPNVQRGKPPFASPKTTGLKLHLPDELCMALRRDALERRVTVKFLILEALAAQGYAVDPASMQEDGRRVR